MEVDDGMRRHRFIRQVEVVLLSRDNTGLQRWDEQC